jgi:hypothetical protein
VWMGELSFVPHGCPPNRSNSAADETLIPQIVYYLAFSDLCGVMEAAVEKLCANYCRSGAFKEPA